jgi:hypothetical protein
MAKGPSAWRAFVLAAALAAGGTGGGAKADAIGGAIHTDPIPLPAAAGQAILQRKSTLRADYGPLAQWFETQANLAYCGVASSVMVLNSLPLEAPAVPGYGTYHFWTQANIFNPANARFVVPQQVARQGMTLEQLHGLLSSLLAGRAVRVERYHGQTLSLSQFRALLRRNLADPADRLLVNYDRRPLGQQGGGHIAPLAAYDPGGDRVLILDVARYRYPAVWVDTARLWSAIRSIDSSSGLSRGLVTIGPTHSVRPGP